MIQFSLYEYTPFDIHRERGASNRSVLDVVRINISSTVHLSYEVSLHLSSSNLEEFGWKIMNYSRLESIALILFEFFFEYTFNFTRIFTNKYIKLFDIFPFWNEKVNISYLCLYWNEYVEYEISLVCTLGVLLAKGEWIQNEK